MEQYIRDKYVTKSFMDSGVKASSGGEDKSNSQFASRFANEINKLKEMGFTDASQCVKALGQSRGNLDNAIELLVQWNASPHPNRTPSSRPFDAVPQSSFSQAPALPTKKPESNNALLDFNGSSSNAPAAIAPPQQGSRRAGGQQLFDNTPAVSTSAAFSDPFGGAGQDLFSSPDAQRAFEAPSSNGFDNFMGMIN